MSSEIPKKTNPETITSPSELEAQLDAFNWEGATVHGSGVLADEVKKVAQKPKEKDPYAHLSEEEKIDAKNWEGLSAALTQTEVKKVTKEPKLEPKDINRQLEQMDRLRDTRKHMREEKTDVGHTEMMAKNEDYKKIQTKIIAIRKRLAEIAVKGEGGEKAKEVQELRHELAQHFKAFRHYIQEQKTPKPEEPKIEPKEKDPYAHLSEEEKIDAKNWEGLSSALTADTVKTGTSSTATRGALRYARLHTEDDIDNETADLMNTWREQAAETESKPETEDPEASKKQNKFEARSELRESFNDWNAKKKAYHSAYETYLEAKKKEGKKSWFKKEQQPQALRELEAAFNEAAVKYSQSVQAAVEKRKQVDPNDQNIQMEKLNPMLAKHLIVREIDQKIALEKEHALVGRGKAIFEKVQETLKKNRFPLKLLGYAAVISGGIVSGSLVAALLGRSVSVYAMAGGSALGAGVTAAGYDDLFLNRREERMDSAAIEARHSYSEQNFEALKKELYESTKKYNSAVENRKYVVAGGAMAGGILASAAFGNVDIDAITENLPDIPDTEPQIPPEPTYLPEKDPQIPDDMLDDMERGDVLSNPPQESPVPGAEDGDVEYPPEKLDGEEKGDAFMNPSQEQETPDGGQEFHTSPDETILEEEDSEEFNVPEMFHTFEQGSRIDTVSEALFETWKEDNNVLEDQLSKKEFLAEMYSAIAEIEKDPVANTELMEQMGITSGDIDEVQVGQTINMQPFFEYLNERN